MHPSVLHSFDFFYVDNKHLILCHYVTGTLRKERLTMFQCVQTMPIVIAPNFQTAVSAPCEEPTKQSPLLGWRVSGHTA